MYKELGFFSGAYGCKSSITNTKMKLLKRLMVAMFRPNIDDLPARTIAGNGFRIRMNITYWCIPATATVSLTQHHMVL